MSEKLVEIKDLEISFGEGSKKFVAVKNANFFINKGETFSLVGESGSGKTTIGRAIIGLNNTSKGEIIFDGHKINGKKSHKESSDLIRRIQMIFQDPAASLNPRLPIGDVISEPLEVHKVGDKASRQKRVYELLEAVEAAGVLQVRAVSTFPAGKEDIALVVDEAVAAAAVEAVIREAAGDLLEEVRLFDVFRGPQLGEGRKSLAFSLRLRAPDRTLTAGELAGVRKRVVKRAAKRLGAELRA